ncbi:conserved hypothetical protein [Maribacter litoralis]|uniref:Uncharacterized protein n=1 Tax=Maribacter litoralis TaxID=2059726 RepID=A0A653QRM3_9FLAO|nr:conserved hypothetical protein [Maribacter litoralis]
MIKKHHHTQFPETPLVRTISVTKLGVSVENVVATIERPNSHHGIVRPDRKNSEEFLPDFFDTYTPIPKTREKKTIINA